MLTQCGAAALCAVALWNFTVRPVHQRISSKSVALSAASAEVLQQEAAAGRGEELGDVTAALERRRREMYENVTLSGDATRVYESVRKLAARARVSIERVEPTTPRQVARGGRHSENEPRGETFGYALEVVGSYGAIAAFMDACERELGVAKVCGARLGTTGTTPAGQEPVLTATVETVHLKLTPPSSGVSAEGAP